MIALPQWADNEAGRDLISIVIAERPQSTVSRGTWIEGGGTTEYRDSRAAGRLRTMHSDWLDRELAALDHQFEVTGHWDDDASKALFQVEDGNQLVERALRETAQEAVLDLTVEPLGDGTFRVAA